MGVPASRDPAGLFQLFQAALYGSVLVGKHLHLGVLAHVFGFQAGTFCKEQLVLIIGFLLHGIEAWGEESLLGAFIAPGCLPISICSPRLRPFYCARALSWLRSCCFRRHGNWISCSVCLCRGVFMRLLHSRISLPAHLQLINHAGGMLIAGYALHLPVQQSGHALLALSDLLYTNEAVVGP